jgi:hypothetical protein
MQTCGISMSIKLNNPSSPSKDGIYEFDLLIEHTLTMSTKLDGGKLSRMLVDFNPENDGGQWTLMGNGTSSNDSNGAPAEGWPPADLLQLDGQHHRVVTINGHRYGMNNYTKCQLSEIA